MKNEKPQAVCGNRDAADIAEYRESLMNGVDKKKFEKHMLSCAACRNAVRGLTNDLQLLKRPVSPVSFFRNLFAAILPKRQLVIGLLPDGLKVPSAGLGRWFVPEFAPAVRGKEQRRVRRVSVPFALPAISGSARILFRSRLNASLECRMGHCAICGQRRLSLTRNGKILEEKILKGSPGTSAEFGPFGKGAYVLRVNGKEIISLRIV